MSANDRNDPNELRSLDNEAAADSTEGELSQDELNNVSGGARLMKDQQPDGRAAFEPDGRAMAARPSDDPSDARLA